jgi:hypothetical protein
MYMPFIRSRRSFNDIFFHLVESKWLGICKGYILSGFIHAMVDFQVAQLHLRLFAKQTIGTIRKTFIVATQFRSRVSRTPLAQWNDERIDTKGWTIFWHVPAYMDIIACKEHTDAMLSAHIRKQVAENGR